MTIFANLIFCFFLASFAMTANSEKLRLSCKMIQQNYWFINVLKISWVDAAKSENLNYKNIMLKRRDEKLWS